MQDQPNQSLYINLQRIGNSGRIAVKTLSFIITLLWIKDPLIAWSRQRIVIHEFITKPAGKEKRRQGMAKAKAEEWLAGERLVILEGWARDGLNDEQIAENMGISVRTLYRWKVQYWQICQSLKKGKDAADRETENVLFKWVKGYDFMKQG